MPATFTHPSNSRFQRTPGLLVSVKNVHEALIAEGSGAEIVDVKDPEKGSLGAASMDVIQGIGRELNGRVRLSVALGESVEFNSSLNQQDRSFWERYDYAKFGLAHSVGTNWQQKLLENFESLSGITNRVMVCYADWQQAGSPVPNKIIEIAPQLKAQVVLFDTYIKDGRSLFDHLSIEELQRFMQMAKNLQLKTVLAGGLDASHFPTAVLLEPNLIAVRGAACVGNRTGEISAPAIARLMGILKPDRRIVDR